MEFENVILEKKDNIATIKLNRPKAFNSLDFGLGDDFAKALEICQDDDEAKVIVITGEGRAFCAGGDVALFKESTDTSDTLRHLIKRLNLCIFLIRNIRKPVIAAINGATGGAGITIAAACDLRICAASVKFRQAYTSIGLIPDGGWTLLVPLLIGFGNASELVYLDPVFDAHKALELGLVNKVVDDGELEKVTRDIASKLAQGPSASFAIIKDNLNSAMLGLLERQLELERKGMIMAGKTADAAEGIASFLEKRKPAFTGQ
jgi:2-(1,2-epoxy-1,2-dihydrophenyl)acetyl-CoA isomerase